MINSRFVLNIPDIVFLIFLIFSVATLIYCLIKGIKIHFNTKEKILYIIFVVIGFVIVLSYGLSYHASGGELSHWNPIFIPITYLLIGGIYYIKTSNKLQSNNER